MEANERLYVLNQLENTRAQLRAAVQGFEPEQWSFRPAAGKWTAAECLEHVVSVESRVLKMIHRTLETPPDPEKTAPLPQKDALIKERIPSRSQRLEAPAPVVPKGLWPDGTGLLDQFEQARARTIDFASASDHALRDHCFPHMLFGDLDCYQWLMLIGAHCERHIKQIEELKSATDFPQPAANPASA